MTVSDVMIRNAWKTRA